MCFQAGTTLKSVDASDRSSGGPMDSRGQLLDAIRHGAKLKSVSDNVSTVHSLQLHEIVEGLYFHYSLSVCVCVCV